MHYITNIQVVDPVLQMFDTQQITYVEFKSRVSFDKLNLFFSLKDKTSLNVLLFESSMRIIRESDDELNTLFFIQFWNSFKPFYSIWELQ